MRVLTIITIALLFFCASCKKKNRCSRAYILEHPMSVYPIQESYNIGDTIWIEMSFSDIFTLWYTRPSNTDEYLTTSAQLKDFNFKINILKFIKLTDNSVNVTGQNNTSFQEAFTYLSIQGTTIANYFDGVAFKLFYSGGQYSLKSAVVCKQSGLYLFSPFFMHYHPSSSYGANEQDITPECESESIRAIHYLINRQPNGSYQTNYHIFEQYMNPALENNIERIQGMSFTFKVN